MLKQARLVAFAEKFPVTAGKMGVPLNEELTTRRVLNKESEKKLGVILTSFNNHPNDGKGAMVKVREKLSIEFLGLLIQAARENENCTWSMATKKVNGSRVISIQANEDPKNLSFDIFVGLTSPFWILGEKYIWQDTSIFIKPGEGKKFESQVKYVVEELLNYDSNHAQARNIPKF